MADITKLQDLDFVQIATPSQGDLILSQSITASDTSLIVNFEPKDEDGASITKDFFIQLTSTNSGKRYTETMLVTAVSGTTLTVVRGIDRGGLDYAGNANNAISHQAGTVIKANLPAGLFQSHDATLKGDIGTGGTHIKIGTGADVNSGIKAFNADANKPYIEYDAATNAWIASNDGTSSFAIGTGAGAITGGDGITVTAGDIDVDRTDTTTFKAVSAGAGDAGKAVLFDADGFVDSDSVQVVKDITATAVEINQALDGISANVTAANLNTLTGGGETILHKHNSLVGSFQKTFSSTGIQTQTIAHSVGIAPKSMKISVHNPKIITTYFRGLMDGMYDGTNYATFLLQLSDGALSNVALSSSAIHTVSWNSTSSGDDGSLDVTITAFDSNNVTLSFNYDNSGGGSGTFVVMFLYELLF